MTGTHFMKNVPAVMATQHPDNASDAYWLNNAFVSTQDEIEECYRTFFELQCDEYMWDWEGKFADEAVLEKLFQKYFDDFHYKQLGRDIYMTLRIPNIWEEKSFKLTRAYMSILSAEDLANSLHLNHPPVFEVILPMTKKASQLIHVKESFKKMADLKYELFNDKGHQIFDEINMIPLFESTTCIMDTPTLLTEYLELHKKSFGTKPSYLRPFIARSDPAMNAGLVPAVLASKVAISDFYQLGEREEIAMYPIIGTGGLPFRGGVNPENIESVVHEYSGIRTMTVQSAFRYDYPLPEVKKAIAYMKKTLPKLKPVIMPAEDKITIRDEIHDYFAKPYTSTIEKAADLVNKIAEFIPQRRERLQHVGLFGYSRGVGKTVLPRAIKFTAAWYSLGIPPEMIGTGRGLKALKDHGKLEILAKYFPSLLNEITHAGKYLNKENLFLLAKQYPFLREIQEDVEHIEDILGIELGPSKPNHMVHRNLVSNILMKLQTNENFEHDIIEAGKMRKSLG